MSVQTAETQLKKQFSMFSECNRGKARIFTQAGGMKPDIVFSEIAHFIPMNEFFQQMCCIDSVRQKWGRARLKLKRGARVGCVHITLRQVVQSQRNTALHPGPRECCGCADSAKPLSCRLQLAPRSTVSDPYTQVLWSNSIN